MSAEPVRLLLVEDDEDDYLLTRELLIDIGSTQQYILDWVTSYEAALEAIRHQQHDVYLLDYRIGAHSGLDLVRAITASGKTAPGILLTGQGDRLVDVEAMEAGAADYLVKGEITPALLDRAIRYARQHAQAQAVLQQRERRFRTLIEHSFDAIVLLGPEGTVIYRSPSMRSILGYTEDAPADSDPLTLVHPEDRDAITAALGRLVALPGGIVHAEYRFRHREGQYRWLEVVATNLLQEAEVGAIVLNIRDSTERKWGEEEYAKLLTREQTARARAEHAEQSLGAIVDCSPLPIVTRDRSGRVQSWNAAAERLFGWSADEVLGQFLPTVTADTALEAELLHTRVLCNEELKDVEVRRQNRSGTLIDLQLAMAPLRDADRSVIGSVAVFTDITERKRSEEAFVTEHTLLHTLMESVPDLIYFKDRDSRFIRVNRAQADTMRLTSKEEASGKTDFDFLPPALAAERYAREQTIMNTAEPSINQLEDGSSHANAPRWYLTTKVPICHDQQVTGLAGITRDITEIRLAEQRAIAAERFRRATLDALDELIAILDEEGTILSVNDSWRRFAYDNGWDDPDPGVGSNYLAICDAATVEMGHVVAEGIRAVIAGHLDSYTQEYPGHAPERNRWFAMRVTRFTGDGPVRVVITHLDITARMEAEEALRRAHGDLERRVAARTAELGEANLALQVATLEAETANRAKSDFLSRMSHELRTPLNAILGFAQILQMRDLGPRDNQSLDYILRAGRQLLELINEVLDIARIEAGRLTCSLEPVDLGLNLHEVVQLTAPLAAQRRVVVHSEVDATAGLYVQADQQRLKQVLLNLLSNAIKYNRLGGQVHLSCSSQEGKRLRLLVTDTGAGLRTEDLPKLFTPFERLAAAQTDVEGTGIGLAICRQLVELMGGSIGVESTEGVGSTFWFELPHIDVPSTQPQDHRRSNTRSALPAPGEQCTVLYIEDNVSNITLVRHLLAGLTDVQLLISMHGIEGLELARTQRPDLILLDLHLPDLMGVEVLRRLKADTATESIPVAILSADATPGTIETLRLSGAAAYLTKPVDVQQLLSLVHTMRRSRGSATHGT